MKMLFFVLVFLPIGFLTGCASIMGNGKDVELSAVLCIIKKSRKLQF